jgi:hypothetical protein
VWTPHHVGLTVELFRTLTDGTRLAVLKSVRTTMKWRWEALVLPFLVWVLTGCSGSGVAAAPSAAVPDAGAVPEDAGAPVPSAVLDLLRELPTYPREMQLLHRLGEKMHIAAATCAGFEDEERAELAKFDELSEAHADRDEAARELGPVMAAVQSAVVPKLSAKLASCREAQRGTADDAALDALMGACFGLGRADFPVTSAGGSTAYGDPMRLPAPQSFKAEAACTEAGDKVAASL